MAFQDDAREQELIALFDLMPGGEGRSGVDAFVILGEEIYEFELKSTTGGGVTTVRDFGDHYLRKWENKHWLIGYYDKSDEVLQHVYYGSPADMSDWIIEKSLYIQPDLKLREHALRGPDQSTVVELFGQREKYDLGHAQRLLKRQISKSEYLEAMDLQDGYSPQKMLELLKTRVGYLMDRGSTLNNPHIPNSYFKGWPKITQNHSQWLRKTLLGQ